MRGSIRVEMPLIDATDTSTFEAFVRTTEPKLRRALVARYGPDVGREATRDALAHAWEHWADVRTKQNPAGYLYRVGQSASRRWLRRRPNFPPAPRTELPWVEPGLPDALRTLTARQRQVVVLVHGFGYSLAEVAELLGLARTSVQNHAERGLEKLRNQLEVSV